MPFGKDCVANFDYNCECLLYRPKHCVRASSWYSIVSWVHSYLQRWASPKKLRAALFLGIQSLIFKSVFLGIPTRWDMGCATSSYLITSRRWTNNRCVSNNRSSLLRKMNWWVLFATPHKPCFPDPLKLLSLVRVRQEHALCPTEERFMSPHCLDPRLFTRTKKMRIILSIVFFTVVSDRGACA